MKFIFIILYGADDCICKSDKLIYQQMHDLSRLYYEKMRLTYDMNYFMFSISPIYQKNLSNPITIFI